MWKLLWQSLGILALLLGYCAGTTASTSERGKFVAAERALANGEVATFHRLTHQLKDYPLYPYLLFAEFERDLEGADARRVKAFLDRYAQTPLAGRLRSAWLGILAKQRRWGEYLAFYRSTGDTRLRCHQLNALLQSGKTEPVWRQAEAIWLHGSSQPKSCDPVLDAWRKAGKLTDKLTWQRFSLAMSANQTGLARYLRRFLNKSERVWADRWLRLHIHPTAALEDAEFKADHSYREEMLAHAVRQLARSDAQAAITMWGKLQDRYRFSADQRYDTERFIALHLARDEDTSEYRFLTHLSPRTEDESLHETQLRAALYREDWPQVLTSIDELPPTMANSERWRYWQARALAETGEQEMANSLFKEVAKERSFYGFLAADHVHADYRLTHNDTPVDSATIARIASMPAARRARELLALGRWIDARREWRDLSKRLSKPELKAAAELAESWNWPDQAIFTLAKTGYWDDLVLRFPVRHKAAIDSNAKRHKLDPAWVLAVVRQESAFMRDAISRSGARGLMQLMPRTARLVARKAYGNNPPNTRELLEADTNIRLGTAYLRQVLDELGDNTMLATAAYNAGPQRVKHWLPEDKIAADLWVELVPFRETRGYLRRVLTYTVIYEHRLGRKPTRLSKLLRPVTQAIALSKNTRNTKPDHKG